MGYAKTTVEEIARRAGVSKTLVYHHFRGKEAIHEAVLGRTLDDWADACRVEDEAGPVLARIAAVLRRSLTYARDNPVLLALFRLDQLVLRDPGGSDVVRQTLDIHRAELIELVEQGLASGELRGDLDAARVADLIRIFHIAFIDNLLNPEWVGAFDEGLMDAGIEVLCSGLCRGHDR